MPIIGNDLFCKSLQRILLAHISFEIGIIQTIDDANLCPGFAKFFADASADSLCAARHHGDFCSNSPMRSSFPHVQKPPIVFIKQRGVVDIENFPNIRAQLLYRSYAPGTIMPRRQ